MRTGRPRRPLSARRSAYDAAGGYDAARPVLDDQDLLVRLFAQGPFTHVDRLLYLQRVHGRNTQVDPTTNATIQRETVELYRDSIAGLAHAWSLRGGLACVRLLTPVWFGPDAEEGFTDVVLPATGDRLPYGDGTVGVLLAADVLQKVVDRAGFFDECYRVLAPGGLLLTLTPSTDGRGAFQDPSHVSFWNENSFMYVTQAALRATLPGMAARFQVSHLRTHFPSPEHESMGISYVHANLIAVKDGPRNGGPLLC